MNLETLTESVEKVVRKGLPQISLCAHHRIRCEGWLKVELVSYLSAFLANQGLEDPRVEINRIDITVLGDRKRFLVELKTFPTNYGWGGKPITNFIDGVIKDLDTLSRSRQPEDIGLSVWLAYPIPEPEPRQWSAHLDRIKGHAAQIVLQHKMELWLSGFAHLYIMRAH